MMRSIVCGVSWVCRVANTRWPVSAAVIAVPIVSRSRISPTRITSGSWRSAALSASANDVASAPSSRWLTMHFLCWCRNSIGSSIVMMCSSRSRLITSIREARVVDLPEPVGPVTSTSPRARLANSATDGGSPSDLQRRDLERDQAERRPERGALEVGVDAEPGRARDLVGEVELPVRLQLLALRVGEDRVDDLPRVGRGEDRIALHRRQPAADAHHRRRPDASGGGPTRGGRRPPAGPRRSQAPCSPLSAAQAGISRYPRDLGHGGQSGLDLLQPVLAQPAHPLAHRDRADLIR